MQTICAIAFTGACSSGSSTAPAPLASIALPSGAALKPFSSTDQGLAKPEGTALTGDGRVWTVLTNLDSMYAPAGPALLVGVVPSTGASTVVDLASGAEADGGLDDQTCLNAGQVKLDKGLLVAACTGNFATGGGTAVVQVDPSSGTVTHTGFVPAGFMPSAVTGGPSKIWVGDTNSTSLISFDRSSFTLDDGASTTQPAIALPCTDPQDMFPYVGDLLADGNDLFALCTADPDGYIVQLNATTGAVVGTAQLVGATPVAMALLGDGRIAVVNSVDGTLALVTRSATGPTVEKAVFTFSASDALQDVKARGLFVYTTSSVTNVVAKLDLSQTVASKMLVGEISTGNGSYPWNIEPIDDNQAVVSLNGTNDLVGVNFSTATPLDAGTAGSSDAGTDGGP